MILEHTFKRFYEEEGEFEILTLTSWFSHYSYSRTSIRSSMGDGWVSILCYQKLGKYSMLSKVLRSKKKEKRKKEKNEKKEKRKEKMKEKREE